MHVNRCTHTYALKPRNLQAWKRIMVSSLALNLCDTFWIMSNDSSIRSSSLFFTNKTVAMRYTDTSKSTSVEKDAARELV